MNRRLPLLIVLACLSVAPLGCKEEHQPSTVEIDPTVRSYTVNGEVVALPVPGDEPVLLRIKHEAIPDYVNDAGEVVGMMAMTMPFPVGPGVEIEGLAEGDAVRVTFDVDYHRQGYPHQITKLEVVDAVQVSQSETEAPASGEHHDHGPHDPHGHHHGDHSDHVGTGHTHE